MRGYSIIRAVVTAPGLNMRAGPSKDQPIVHVLTKDDVVVVNPNTGVNGWLYVRDPKTDKHGFVSSAHVKIVPPKPDVPAYSEPVPPTQPIMPGWAWAGVFLGIALALTSCVL